MYSSDRISDQQLAGGGELWITGVDLQGKKKQNRSLNLYRSRMPLSNPGGRKAIPLPPDVYTHCLSILYRL